MRCNAGIESNTQTSSALLRRAELCHHYLWLQEVFDNILERRIEWPGDMSPGCRDLCDRLLCSEPGRRLGARGAGEVRPGCWLELKPQRCNSSCINPARRLDAAST